MVAVAVKKGSTHISYCPFDQIAETVKREAKAGDIIITMGAGVLYQTHSGIIEKIKDKI